METEQVLTSKKNIRVHLRRNRSHQLPLKQKQPFMMKTIIPTIKGVNSDPVSINGVGVVPSLLESRSRKFISSRKKNSSFSKITMNDSIRQKPEKSPKRCRQRDLKDNHWQSTVKPVWEHIVETKAHQTMKSNENKLKVFHKNILKPIVYQDPALLQLRAEKQKQRTEKTILKKHIDVKKDQQRREALKSGGPKTIMEVVKKAHLLGYAVSEIRKSSLEIYALNELMKTLENAEFQRFCNVAGIYPKE